jgi:aminoglycoside phosphotransferase (APT) family kinase protein
MSGNSTLETTTEVLLETLHEVDISDWLIPAGSTSFVTERMPASERLSVHGLTAMRWERLPLMYPAGSSRGTFRLISPPSFGDEMGTYMLKVNCEPMYIERERQMARVVAGMKPTRFRTPKVYGYGVYARTSEISYAWLLAEWVKHYKHRDLTPHWSKEIAKALAEFHLEQPSINALAAIAETKAPPYDLVQRALRNRHTTTLAEVSEKVQQVVSIVSSNLRDFLSEAIGLAENSLALIEEPEALKLVHGDFHRFNILCPYDASLKLVVVDWEEATVHSPLFDVAYFAAWHNPDPLCTSAFLGEYWCATEKVLWRVPHAQWEGQVCSLAAFLVLRNLGWQLETSQPENCVQLLNDHLVPLQHFLRDRCVS